MLTKESARLTTFITPFGRYCFNRILFGITLAPEHFSTVCLTFYKAWKVFLSHLWYPCLWKISRRAQQALDSCVTQSCSSRDHTQFREIWIFLQRNQIFGPTGWQTRHSCWSKQSQSYSKDKRAKECHWVALISRHDQSIGQVHSKLSQEY